MWLLELVPIGFLKYIIHAIVIIGAISTFLSFFVINRLLRIWPAAAGYYHILQILSLSTLLIGVYSLGSISCLSDVKEQIEEEEDRNERIEEKSKEENTKIITKYVDRVRVVHEKGNNIIEYIEKEVTKFDNTCPVPKEVVHSINAAAENRTIESKK